MNIRTNLEKWIPIKLSKEHKTIHKKQLFEYEKNNTILYINENKLCFKNPPNPASFSTTNKVGGVAGCTGATTGVQGAASDAGSQYMLKGGTNYYGFKNAGTALTGSMKGSYAPISKGSHNKCGGRKSRRRSPKRHGTRHRRKSKHHRRKSKHHRRKSKHHRRKSKHHRRKSKRRTYKRRSQRVRYSQYLSNVPMLMAILQEVQFLHLIML